MLYYLRTYQKLELRADFLRLVERELWAQNKTESEALAEIPEKAGDFVSSSCFFFALTTRKLVRTFKGQKPQKLFISEIADSNLR